MAQLVVRNISADVKEKLRARATRNARSLEAEVRNILTEAAASADDDPQHGLGSRIADLFKDVGLTEAERNAFDREIELKRSASIFGE